MYAAAGGASLASRQARQRQRQQKKTAAAAARLHPPKAAALVVAEHGASTPTRGTSRQFHQLPNNYLRTPQSQARKLSASYTAQSKLLLPIEEGDTQSVLHSRMNSHVPPQHHSHSHAHAHQNVPITTYGAHQHQYYQPYSDESGGPLSPKLYAHRLSGGSCASFQHAPLPKSATAMLPLVSHTVEPTPPTSPAAAAVELSLATPTTAAAVTATIAIPQHDAIIVTPATPMASPGHVPRLRPPADLDLPETADEKQPLTSADSGAEEESDEAMQPPRAALERKCSVYRMRRSDAFEDQQGIGSMKRQFKELQLNQETEIKQLQQLQQQQQQYEPIPIDEPQMVFKGLTSGRKWQVCAYCEEGICVCEHLEVKCNILRLNYCQIVYMKV